jgi:hypothetical protein
MLVGTYTKYMTSDETCVRAGVIDSSATPDGYREIFAPETTQVRNPSVTDYTAKETSGEAKTKSQGYVYRTKTEVIETALNKTGIVIQQKCAQGMRQARVAVDKVRELPSGPVEVLELFEGLGRCDSWRFRSESG